MPTIGQNATVLTELSFYKQDGTVCDYQLTYIGFTEYIINSPSTLDGKKDALTDSQTSSYVNWRFEGLNSSAETAPIFNNILLSAEIPRDAFKMVTKWYDNTRTPNFRIDFVEDPSFGINIDRDDIDDYRDTYFTEDGTSTSTGLFALTVGHPYLLEYKKTDMQVYFLARQDGRTEDNGNIAMESLFFQDANGNTVSYVMDYINRNNLISTLQQMSNTELTSRLGNNDTERLSWASVKINDTLFYEQDLIRITVPKTATRVSIRYRDMTAFPNPSRMQGLTVYSPTNEFATVHLPANSTTTVWTATNFTMTYPSLPASIWTGVNMNSVSIKIMSVPDYWFDVTEFRLTDFDGNILAYTIETDFETTGGGLGDLTLTEAANITLLSETLQSYGTRTWWWRPTLFAGSYFNLIPVDPSALVARVDLVFSVSDRSSDVEITFRGQSHYVSALPSDDLAVWNGISFEDMQKQTAVYNPSVVVPPMYTVLGLESNTSYDFQVTKNTDVNSPVSSVVTDSTLAIQASAPTLSVVSKTSTSVSLSWADNSNGDAFVTGYVLEYKKASDPNFVSTPFVIVTTQTIVGLEPETSYNFRVIKNTNINSPYDTGLNAIVTDPLAVVIVIDPIDFNYNGSEQIWTSPGDGTILVWLQGGTGGNYGTRLGGEGGFIAVEIDVQKDVAYKIRVAGPGVNRSGGRHGGGGGGASGFFDPTTNTWMAIAGGGGGSGDRGSGGAGGVPTIWNGTNGGGPNSNSYGKLGTTTSVGLGGTGRRNALAGALHDGGKGGTEGTGPYAGGYGVGSGGLGGKGGNDYAGGGGGGGWFGGGGGGIASDGHGAGGGGGSSYYDGTNVALSSTQSATKYLVGINGFVRISAV